MSLSSNDKMPTSLHIEGGHTDASTPGHHDIVLAGKNLGTTRLELANGDRVLIPTPSNDPNDPLNWTQKHKYFMAAIACAAALLSNALAAGPTVAMVKIAMDFTEPMDIQKTSYFFSVTSLFQGISMFFWIPLINKFGRRPLYIIATTLYLITAIWCAVAKQYNVELVGRFFIGFMAGGAECLAPLTIADVFFLHERGRMMAAYTVFLSMGVAIGIIVDGIIDIGLQWRWMYWIWIIVIGVLLAACVFGYEETAYNRTSIDEAHIIDDHSHHAFHHHEDKHEKHALPFVPAQAPPAPARKTYAQRMKFYTGIKTEESLWKMFYRPFGMIFLPAVFFAAWVFSVTIGFLVAITSNFDSALSAPPYNFVSWKAGLCFFGGVLGSLIGIPMGGQFSDWVCARAARKNGGVFQPEMRLPAMAPCVITGPLALVLYGVGIQHGLHWMVPTLGFFFLSLTICWATNVAMTYAIDVYKPVTGEVLVAILAFKAIFGYALAWGTNDWIASQGYQNAFGQMAAICAAFLLLWIPLYFYGERLRHQSYEWRIMKALLWSSDRDDQMLVMD